MRQHGPIPGAHSTRLRKTDQLLSRVRHVRAQGGQEVERGKDAGRGGIAAGAALAAAVDDLPAFRAIAHTFEGYRGVNHVAGQAPAGLVIVGIYAFALKNREARGNPIPHDLDQARRDLFPCEQRLDELVPEQLDEADRIRGRNGDKGSSRGDKAVGNQTVQMRMKPAGIIAIALQGGDHAGQCAAIPGGMLEELLDGGVEALAQEAEQLAVVLEAEAEHFGDGDDVLADGEVAEDLLVDVLRKQQGPLLVA